jgi:hypothetical protein
LIDGKTKPLPSGGGFFRYVDMINIKMMAEISAATLEGHQGAAGIGYR